MKRSKILLVSFLLLAVVLSGAGWWAYQSGLIGGGLPQSVRSKAKFPIYFPVSDISPYSIDRASIKITTDHKNKELQVFSFILRSKDRSITITEQASPDLVSDQIGLDKLASLMQAYKEVVTSIGRIELTRPKERNGGQTVVADPNFTTLIFANPDQEVSEDDWQKIFSSLEVVR